jgi:hypothetical protein
MWDPRALISQPISASAGCIFDLLAPLKTPWGGAFFLESSLQRDLIQGIGVRIAAALNNNVVYAESLIIN